MASNVVSSYGAGFAITNFTKSGGGTGAGTWLANNGAYSFTTTTGVLTSVPEPSSYRAILGAALLIGVALRRRRMAMSP